MNMNQADIQMVASNNHACPNVRKAVKLLSKLLEAVNAQSDGWAYWPAPGKASEKLQELIRSAGNVWYDTHGTITAEQLRKAVTPIRSMVTHQKKLQAKYGNKFNFDVDAALAS